MSIVTRAGMRQFAKFLIVGVVNTLVSLCVIYAAKWFLNMRDVPANAIGYAMGIFVSFALNSSWTFAHKGPRASALARFCLATAVAYGMNLLTVLIAIDQLQVNSYVGQALGIPVYTLTSYLLSRHLVFGKLRAVK
jgi:putative flippase GtrA